MIEITIQGLNQRQRALAELIWACETKEDIDRFVKGLPTKELRREARVVFDMILMATIEQAYDGLGVLNKAQDLIEKVRR